jgi:septum site-determining protein MinD
VRNAKDKVVTITSGKGGVGKTTTTANLAVALASLGQKVVCIDGDIGLRNLDVVLGLENRIVYDLVDVIEGRCRLRQAMIRDKRLPELYLIPAAQTRDKSAISPSDMVRLCDELKPDFDWILIDSPAGIERGFRNVLAPANIVLVITNPEVSAVRDADRIIGLIESEEKGPAKLIINRLNPGLVRRGDMLNADDVIELLAIDLIGIIPDDENVVISTNRGQPIAFDGKSKAGQAYQNIAHRLMGDNVPFLKIEEKKDFFGRLTRLIRPGGN